MIKQEFLLAMIGGVFVMEALSVILQVASFKLFRKRIFKMTPLQHHFEMIGWSETQVTMRFWMVGMMVDYFTAYSRGWESQVTSAVKDLTGIEARGIAEFARDHAAAFGKR